MTWHGSVPRYQPPPPIDPTRHSFKVPKLRSSHSAVWDVFRVVEGEDEEGIYKDWAFCSECKAWWRRPGGSTYGLLKHIHQKHRPLGEDGQPLPVKAKKEDKAVKKEERAHKKEEKTAAADHHPPTPSPLFSLPSASSSSSSPPPPSSSSSSSSSSSLLAAARSLSGVTPPSTHFTPLTLEYLRASQHNFATERAWHPYHTPRNLLLALMGELGELSEIFQWKGEVPPGLTGWSADEREHVGEELSDVLLYLIRLSDVCGVDIGASVEQKIAKNSKKYPVERVKGKSEKYDEYSEYEAKTDPHSGTQHRITAQIEKDKATTTKPA